MLNWNGGVGRCGRAALGACLALVVAQTAAAEMYAWRTDDGGYAYTDDKDQIPERYRAQAKLVSNASLKSYERYTPEDPQASARYAERLERRLAALRAMNAVAPQAPVAHAAPGAPHSGSLMISTGNANAPAIEMPMASNGAPLVVEPVLSKATGDPRTRTSTLVKQGDSTIAVILGKQAVFDPVQGIKDEGELIEGK
ncbi:MAG TPA: hypothetical protein VMW19_17710 [Myxococcota bacterium]|nr:hypothetical protein [Myxococcota bacterium]